MINNFLSFLLRQIKKKWVFKKYPVKKILILDRAIELNLEEDFFQIPNNEINFLLIIEIIFRKVFLNKKIRKLSFVDSYCKILIEKINPKVMIGHECDLITFKSKKFFPEKILIIFQFASYSEIYKSAARKRHLDHMSLKNEKIKVDYFCVYDEWHKNFFDYYDAEFIITGSVKNNSIISTKKNKKNDIMLISEFRTKVKSYHGTNNNVSTMRLADVCISYIAKIVSEYSIESQKKFSVALVSNRKDKKYKEQSFRNNEIEFFKRDIKNFKEEKIDSMSLAEESELIICLTSNLGNELISRGKKVLFLNIHYFVLPWYFLPNKSGPFWYQGQDKNIIKEKIEYLLSLSNEEWSQILEKNKIIMKFDPGNRILKNKIKDILNE
tara:strand:+ start:2122 stop:3267 length:1146 start_codon:yes stop_codon:yes gene_type:complete